MAEIITKDCKEYHIWDKVNGVWNRLFFKTNAKSVEADDGNNMQTKCGAINGISSSSTATDENIAASIGYVNQELNQINSDLGNIVITKLWENHEPTSSFPAQTITITNLSDYEIIIFDFIEGINVVSHLSAISFFNVPVTLFGQTAGNHFVSRYASFSNNSISFSSGAIDATANDNRAIPYAIYGIKVL